jgi:hypothetical protein
MIEQEPIQEGFTLEELEFLHTAVCNEMVQVYFPPIDEKRRGVACSASEKLTKLIKEALDEDTLDS